ncbi:MAG: acetyl-CoA carboxylase carboxyltransferase subunit alpha [Coriobacteriia bacterium]|nr:acetyl-CoA carboxylase carboxyltransferase subunit alpha [Coriobacteriia bacterium]
MPRKHVMEFERPLVELEEKLEQLRRIDVSATPELATEVDSLAREIERLHDETYRDLGPWERVQVSRHPDRPRTDDYVAELFTDAIELRGDRAHGDDEAMFAALATLQGRRVAVLGHRKGRDTKENLRRHFGMPHPEGYRKALRVMRLADRFGLPLVTFVDTQGAYPGKEAEERGVGWAIAECLAGLVSLRVPVVSINVGEGGSGGALAIGFGDRLVMLENSYYSVITPEACASILHKDASQAPLVAGCLAMTAEDMVRLGLADQVVPEPLGGAHRDAGMVYAGVRKAVTAALEELTGEEREALAASRYERLRTIGAFSE